MFYLYQSAASIPVRKELMIRLVKSGILVTGQTKYLHFGGEGAGRKGDGELAGRKPCDKFV